MLVASCGLGHRCTPQGIGVKSGLHTCTPGYRCTLVLQSTRNTRVHMLKPYLAPNSVLLTSQIQPNQIETLQKAQQRSNILKYQAIFLYKIQYLMLHHNEVQVSGECTNVLAERVH